MRRNVVRFVTSLRSFGYIRVYIFDSHDRASSVPDASREIALVRRLHGYAKRKQSGSSVWLAKRLTHHLGIVDTRFGGLKIQAQYYSLVRPRVPNQTA